MRLNKMIHVENLNQSLAQSNHLVNVSFTDTTITITVTPTTRTTYIICGTHWKMKVWGSIFNKQEKKP